jgi:hypothetical protein
VGVRECVCARVRMCVEVLDRRRKVPCVSESDRQNSYAANVKTQLQPIHLKSSFDI